MKKLFLLCSLLVLTAQLSRAQTTIVNYDFNAGTSYASLSPSVAANITCAMTSSSITYSRTGTGDTTINGFTRNATAGMPLVSGTANSGYWQFTLGGSNLNLYKGYMVYVDHQVSAAGTTKTLQLSYSTNGTTWTNVGTPITTIAAFVQQAWNLGSITDLNNKSAVYFRLTVGGVNGTTSVRIDNFQVLAFNNATSPAGYYRSKASGNWTSAATWEYSADNNLWTDAASAPDANAIITTVRSGHTVTGTTTIVAQQIIFEAGSTYEHNKNGGYIPSATWNPASTLLITGQTYTNPFYGDQNFGNVTINSSGMNGANAAIGNNNAGTMQILGTLTVANTGNTFLSQFSTPLTVGNFVQTGGIFQMVGGGTARTLNINGDITLSGGTFDMARGNASLVATLNLYGNFSQSGTDTLKITATSNAADGNFNFAGNTVQTFSKTGGVISCSNGPNLIFSINNGAIVDFGTSVLSNTGGTATAVQFTLASGGTIITAHPQGLSTSASTGTIQVGGTKTFNTAANYIYNGAAQSTGNALPSTVNNLTLGGSGVKTRTNAVTVNGIFSMEGNETVTISAVPTYGTTATLQYKGTVAQTAGIEFLNTMASGRTVIIDNSNGVTISGPKTISGTLNLKNGALITGANNLTIGSGGSVVRTNGSVVGNLVKSLVAGNSYTFEVGTSSTKYTPVQLGSVVGNGTFTVSAITGAHPNSVGTNVLQMYWKLTNGGITSTNLTFNYLDADVVGDENQYELGRYNGSWANISPVVLNTTNNTASISGINSFSDWTLGEDGELPVELTSFSYSVNGSSIKLNWSTSTEVNNFGFEVERFLTTTEQAKGVWEKISFVAGNGNSNSPKNYSYEDLNVASGKYSYRLKQIDVDGQFEYSNSIEVDLSVPTEFALEQNYPNPFNPVTNIRYSLPTESNVELKVFDVLGNEVQTLVSTRQSTGVYNVQFDANNFASGTYIFRIQIGDQFVQSRKMILIK